MCALNTQNLPDYDEEDYIRDGPMPRMNIKDHDYACTHTPEQRSWIGTYTHIELMKALQCGYKVKKVLWAWTWKKWDSFIFQDYIRCFYKMKSEADWDENRPVEERDEFMKMFKEIYDVDLDVTKMKKNEGMRYLAKQCLNSVRLFPFKLYQKNFFRCGAVGRLETTSPKQKFATSLRRLVS